MRRALSVASLAVVLSSASAGRALCGDVPIPEMRESLVILTSPSSHTQMDGRLIAEAINELRRRSATFDQMLGTLAASRVLTFISPSVDVRRQAGLIGRTRFAIGKSRIVAIVEVGASRDDVRIRREAIAHEVAHVVEVACLGPIESQEALYQRLRPQLVWFSDSNRARPMETRFADRAAKTVMREAGGRRTDVSQLGRLAAREGLTACPAVQPGSALVIAQTVAPESAEQDPFVR